MIVVLDGRARECWDGIESVADTLVERWTLQGRENFAPVVIFAAPDNEEYIPPDMAQWIEDLARFLADWQRSCV